MKIYFLEDFLVFCVFCERNNAKSVRNYCFISLVMRGRGNWVRSKREFLKIDIPPEFFSWLLIRRAHLGAGLTAKYI